MKRTQALLVAVVAAVLVCAGLAPAHARSGVYQVGKEFQWHYAGHTITFDYVFITQYGDTESMTAVYLDCAPTDSSKWGSGNNVDGLTLDWGSYNETTGDYSVKDSILNGGNIPACSTQYDYNLSGGYMSNPSSTNYHARIHYRFATNFANPANDVTPNIWVHLPGNYGSGGGGGGSDPCGAVDIGGSAGTIDSCVTLYSIPVG